jgi:FkbM family methyltransferase
MKESYAQVGEDLVVDHYLGEPTGGYYVDIGAYEPMHLSNTYLFYKRGWKGVCVEPNALLAGEYRETRPKDQFYTEACGTGELKFKLSDEHDSLSKVSDSGVPIKSRPLSEYLAMLPRVDLLSVDCEGMELEILKSNDWGTYRPTMVVVEVIDYVTKKKNQSVIDFMLLQGYGLVCDNSINAIFLERGKFNEIFLIK